MIVDKTNSTYEDDFLHKYMTTKEELFLAVSLLDQIVEALCAVLKWKYYLQTLFTFVLGTNL